MDLKRKTFSGVKWQLVNKIAQKIISVSTFAVLARILEPSTFGLFAMAFILIDGFHILKSFGIDSALIQRKSDIDAAAQTAYILVQITGLIPAVLTFLAAPLIAQIFNKPELLHITRALSAIFVLNSFSKIPLTMLAREMKFNLIAVSELIGACVNSLVAIGYASLSPSIWSLVVAYLAKQAVMAMLNRKFSRFRVKWQFQWTTAKELFRYGKFIAGLGLLYYFYEYSNNFIVAKIFGATFLGYYVLALNVGNFINTHFNYLVQSVLFPAYATLQHDSEELKRVYLKTVRTITAIAFPFCALLYVGAADIVSILYGPKWQPVVPLLRLFALVQLVVPMMSCSSSLFNGTGKPEYNFRILIVALVIKIPLVIYLAKCLGVSGVILAELISQIFLIPINYGLLKGIIQVHWRDLGLLIVKALPATSATAITYIAVRRFTAGFPYTLITHLLSVALAASLAIMSYLVLLYYQDRIFFAELSGFLSPKSPKRH
jgi:O-antigen/teichoic acid export membrane protein